MRKKSPTLVCRLSTPLTAKALEHVVLAYNLLRGRADRAKVAEAAQETAEEEAPHAALPAQLGQAALSDVRFRGVKRISRGRAPMPAFDTKRTSAVGFCCEAQCTNVRRPLRLLAPWFYK